MYIHASPFVFEEMVDAIPVGIGIRLMGGKEDISVAGIATSEQNDLNLPRKYEKAHQ